MRGFRNFRSWVQFIFDILMIGISYVLAYVVYSVMLNRTAFEASYLVFALVVMLVHVVIFLLFSLHKVIWKRATPFSYIRLIVGLGMSFAFSYTFCKVIFPKETGLSTFSLGFVLSIGMLVLTRYAYIFSIRGFNGSDKNSQSARVLIVGGGSVATFLVAEMHQKRSTFHPVCIVDDDVFKIGRQIDDVPIVDKTEGILKACEKYNISVIFYTISNATPENKRRILDLCAETGCKVYTLPDIYSIKTPGEILSQAKDIDINDFLNRNPITLNSDNVQHFIEGKICLVTGGGGSIGSELCRQIAAFNPGRLVIVDNNENNCFEVESDLYMRFGKTVKASVEIANIRDASRIEVLFKQYNPDIVIHAAAHKHVTYMENNPEEAVKSNVAGTYNVARLAHQYGCEKFILISTDKAVNTTNAMGATKRCCELIMQYFSCLGGGTRFSAVRFGNVLGSAGSVVPLFKKQIEMGGPLTVTDCEVTRYFMTIPEASALILQAATFAQNGEIYILDMGEPVKILDLAQKMISLYGRSNEIEIITTGLKKGEKLHEELYYSHEDIKRTENDKIFVESRTDADFTPFIQMLDQLFESAGRDEREATLKKLYLVIETFSKTKEDKRYI